MWDTTVVANYSQITLWSENDANQRSQHWICFKVITHTAVKDEKKNPNKTKIPVFLIKTSIRVNPNESLFLILYNRMSNDFETKTL